MAISLIVHIVLLDPDPAEGFNRWQLSQFGGEVRLSPTEREVVG
jgi:hypothetical protein